MLTEWSTWSRCSEVPQPATPEVQLALLREREPVPDALLAELGRRRAAPQRPEPGPRLSPRRPEARAVTSRRPSSSWRAAGAARGYPRKLPKNSGGGVRSVRHRETADRVEGRGLDGTGLTSWSCCSGWWWIEALGVGLGRVLVGGRRRAILDGPRHARLVQAGSNKEAIDVVLTRPPSLFHTLPLALDYGKPLSRYAFGQVRILLQPFHDELPFFEGPVLRRPVVTPHQFGSSFL